MTELTQQRVRDLLATIVDPHTELDLMAGGAVKGVGVDGNKVAVDIVLAYPARGALKIDQTVVDVRGQAVVIVNVIIEQQGWRNMRRYHRLSQRDIVQAPGALGLRDGCAADGVSGHEGNSEGCW